MRVAALEDNVAFLEEWCEEQQDVLDRSLGAAAAYDYEIEPESAVGARAVLRVVDLRDEALGDDETGDDDADSETIVAVVETDHDRKVRLIRARLERLRVRLVSAVESAAASGGGPPAAGG